jgi:23S rRNA (uridine2552-2'-O)-methyltransferase
LAGAARFGAIPFCAWTPNNQQLADVLHGGCTELFAYRTQKFFARGTVVTVDSNLDELMTGKAGRDFLENGVRQAVLADGDHGIQDVCLGTQAASFVGRETKHGSKPSIEPFQRAHSTDNEAMKRTRTSNAWLREHVNDPYVQRARAEGYRSRASFKLMEIDDKDNLIRAGEIVVDLGATPGGWSQVAAKRMNGKGRVIALDLLEMEPLHGVEFIQGDFREEEILRRLETLLAGERLGLVLSDMAPNMSGIPVSDQARVMHLAELGLEFSRSWLKPDGAFLVKVFQGHGFSEFVQEMRKVFKVVASRKPDASRDRSAEVYLLGKGLKN